MAVDVVARSAEVVDVATVVVVVVGGGADVVVEAPPWSVPPQAEIPRSTTETAADLNQKGVVLRLEEPRNEPLPVTSRTLGVAKLVSANPFYKRSPDYELEPTLTFETTEQYRALFEETRMQIVDMLLERAATIKELSNTLGIPKGTIGHHVAVLETAGLIHVVRTQKVRAIEAKYYGRTARTYLLTGKPDEEIDMAHDSFLTQAATAYAKAAAMDSEVGPMSTLRHARIPDSRAREWAERLADLVSDFTAEERRGDTTYGLLVAFYPTDRPHLPDVESVR